MDTNIDLLNDITDDFTLDFTLNFTDLLNRKSLHITIPANEQVTNFKFDYIESHKLKRPNFHISLYGVFVYINLLKQLRVVDCNRINNRLSEFNIAFSANWYI